MMIYGNGMIYHPNDQRREEAPYMQRHPILSIWARGSGFYTLKHCLIFGYKVFPYFLLLFFFTLFSHNFSKQNVTLCRGPSRAPLRPEPLYSV